MISDATATVTTTAKAAANTAGDSFKEFADAVLKSMAEGMLIDFDSLTITASRKINPPEIFELFRKMMRPGRDVRLRQARRARAVQRRKLRRASFWIVGGG